MSLFKYLIFNFLEECNFATSMFFSTKSTPVTSKPNLAKDSDTRPPPHPTSNILIFIFRIIYLI